MWRKSDGPGASAGERTICNLRVPASDEGHHWSAESPERVEGGGPPPPGLAVSDAIKHNRPYGSDPWTAKIEKRLGIGPLRERGRPKIESVGAAGSALARRLAAKLAGYLAKTA